MNPKRKLIYLSSLEYSEDVVDNINRYFDMGYEIEEILDANCGYYFLLILKGSGNYDYAKNDYNLIEEKNNQWVKSVTKNTNLVYN